MKLFHQISSCTFRNLVCISMKTLEGKSLNKISNTGGRCFTSCLLPQFPVSFHSCVSKLHTGCTFYINSVEGTQKSVSALQARKRVPRKKIFKGEDLKHKETWSTVAYSSAKEYDMPALARGLEMQGLYKTLPLPEDAGEVIHVSNKYVIEKEPHQIFFFSEGTVVFWNVPDLEQQNVLNFLKKYEINSFDVNLVNEEKEDLDYIYSEDACRFSNGCIILNSTADTSLYTYTFSNSMSHSVKLAMWEAALEKYIDSMEEVTENMKKGGKITMSRNQVFKKRGELFALRHAINLSSDLLDTPDFYWDRQDLEILFQKTRNYLNIAKRTKVMNERLSYCSELIDLLGNHMNDNHHVRLEWMIIVLIMVEVMFECIHFMERIIH